jgi:methylated-DNA-protein-cysteine methyltransferase related protein
VAAVSSPDRGMGRPARSAPNAFDGVYALVARIPAGSVTTYGRVAAMTPVPSGARGVGWALAGLPPERDDVPWWRVVSATGRITNTANEELQRSLLEGEGIVVPPAGRIDLERHLWHGTS